MLLGDGRRLQRTIPVEEFEPFDRASGTVDRTHPFFQPQLPSPAKIVVLIIVTLLIGFQEEAIFRGVLLRALRPQGVMKAVLISAALFGIIHINSLLVGRDPIFVLSQVIASFFGAIGLGALRIRMNTVVPHKSEEHKPRSHGV